MFRNKRIIVLVTGSISAYKAAEIVSWLSQNGALVDVFLTKAAVKFIGPLTFKALSGRKVYFENGSCDLSEEQADQDYQKYDLFLVLPATANIIAKAAHGITNDLVSFALIKAELPVIFFPAMHCNMYANPMTQKNIAILKEQGYYFIEPSSGHLACGAEGKGRLADLSDIKAAISRFLFYEREWTGLEILITAGPTREKLDPVRYLSNFSSGKMGYALAEAALRKGAKVNLVSGPTCIMAPFGVNLYPVESANEMYEVVHNLYDTADVVIKAAAVADYHIKDIAENKIKKQDRLSLELEINPDILYSLGEKKGWRILVGFAAETDNLKQYAVQKLKEKNLDLIIANNVSLEGAGFNCDTNIITIIGEDSCLELPKMSKIEAATKILEAIGHLPRFFEIKQRKSKEE